MPAVALQSLVRSPDKESIALLFVSAKSLPIIYYMMYFIYTTAFITSNKIVSYLILT